MELLTKQSHQRTVFETVEDWAAQLPCRSEPPIPARDDCFNDDSITKFTPGDVGSLFANTGLLSGPAFIAIGFPEPSSVVPAVLGFVGIATWWWRRSRS